MVGYPSDSSASCSKEDKILIMGPDLGVFPLEQTRHVGVAKSEHPRLTNDEIVFEEFQPM